MQNSFAEVSTLTILISTVLLLLLGGIVVYYLFLYQRKKFAHQQEVMQLREAFSHTLLQSKLEIQEQTLDHISKELHANFSHIVSLININLSTLSLQKQAEAKEKITETKSLAKQLMAELKALSVSLNTDHIMHIGFIKALENELKRLDRTGKYRTSLTKTGHDYDLVPENEIILFRICQEILNNIIQHALADKIIVTLDYSPDLFKLSIQDNGKGFDLNEVTRQSGENKSTGIRNIYNRSKLINADVEIKSNPGNGTIIIVTIPSKQH